MVHMELNDDTWHLVKDTPKVTGFIGSKDEPVAIPEEDAAKIIAQMQEGVLRPKPKIKFEHRGQGAGHRRALCQFCRGGG